MAQTETKPAIVTPGQHLINRAGAMTRGEAELYASAMARGLDLEDMRVFVAICKHTQLDPFRREIYAWKQDGKLTIHLAINGWRAIAARSGEYVGQVGPYWCGEDGVWKDVWLAKEPPAAAKVGVRVRGSDEPTFATVTMKEFGRNTPVWKEKPAHMLAVRAEYHALQRACPAAYDTVMQEIKQAGNVSVEVVSAEEIQQLGAGQPTDAGAPNAQAGGDSGREAPAAPAETDPAPPSAQQPELLGDQPTPLRPLADAWDDMVDALEARGKTLGDIAQHIGKQATTGNVERYLISNRLTWEQLVEQVAES